MNNFTPQNTCRSCQGNNHHRSRESFVNSYVPSNNYNFVNNRQIDYIERDSRSRNRDRVEHDRNRDRDNHRMEHDRSRERMDRDRVENNRDNHRTRERMEHDRNRTVRNSTCGCGR